MYCWKLKLGIRDSVQPTGSDILATAARYPQSADKIAFVKKQKIVVWKLMHQKARKRITHFHLASEDEQQ